MAKSTYKHPKLSGTAAFVVLSIIIAVIVLGLLMKNETQNLESEASSNTTLSQSTDLLTLEAELKRMENDSFFREIEAAEEATLE